jgi:hypothetical protein
MQTYVTFDGFLEGRIPGALPVFQGFPLWLAQNVSPAVRTVRNKQHSKRMAAYLAGMK